MRLVLRSRKWKSATGREELIGAQGVVVSALLEGVEGMIRIHGELWKAVSAQTRAGRHAVRVLRIEGLKLYVEPSDRVETVSGFDQKFWKRGGEHHGDRVLGISVMIGVGLIWFWNSFTSLRNGNAAWSCDWDVCCRSQRPRD